MWMSGVLAALMSDQLEPGLGLVCSRYVSSYPRYAAVPELQVDLGLHAGREEQLPGLCVCVCLLG